MKYKECSLCGATLDFGEKCTCTTEERKIDDYAKVQNHKPKAVYNSHNNANSKRDTDNILLQLRNLQEQLRSM